MDWKTFILLYYDELKIYLYLFCWQAKIIKYLNLDNFWFKLILFLKLSSIYLHGHNFKSTWCAYYEAIFLIDYFSSKLLTIEFFECMLVPYFWVRPCHYQIILTIKFISTKKSLVKCVFTWKKVPLNLTVKYFYISV